MELRIAEEKRNLGGKRPSVALVTDSWKCIEIRRGGVLVHETKFANKRSTF